MPFSERPDGRAPGPQALLDSSSGELMGGHAELVLPAVLAMVIVTVILAALGPARQSLRIHPAELLRAE